MESIEISRIRSILERGNVYRVLYSRDTKKHWKKTKSKRERGIDPLSLYNGIFQSELQQFTGLRMTEFKAAGAQADVLPEGAVRITVGVIFGVAGDRAAHM